MAYLHHSILCPCRSPCFRAGPSRPVTPVTGPSLAGWPRVPGGLAGHLWPDSLLVTGWPVTSPGLQPPTLPQAPSISLILYSTLHQTAHCCLAPDFLELASIKFQTRGAVLGRDTGIVLGIFRCYSAHALNFLVPFFAFLWSHFCSALFRAPPQKHIWDPETLPRKFPDAQEHIPLSIPYSPVPIAHQTAPQRKTALLGIKSPPPDHQSTPTGLCPPIRLQMDLSSEFEPISPPRLGEQAIFKYGSYD